MRILFVVVLILINLYMPALSKVYKWVDENGVTHYSEQQPELISTDEIKVNIGNKKQNYIQLTEADIAGQWLVDENIFTSNLPGANMIWEFKAGEWTTIKAGERIPSGIYTLNENMIDFGEILFTVNAISNNTIKAEYAGTKFTITRK